MPVFRKGKKKDPGNYVMISFTTVTEDYEGTFLEAVSRVANRA